MVIPAHPSLQPRSRRAPVRLVFRGRKSPFPVLSAIPESHHKHNGRLLYSWMAVGNVRVCGGAGGGGSDAGGENPESEY